MARFIESDWHHCIDSEFGIRCTDGATGYVREDEGRFAWEALDGEGMDLYKGTEGSESFARMQVESVLRIKR